MAMANTFWNDKYGMLKARWIFAFSTIAVVIVMFGIFSAVVYGGRANGRGTCSQWEQQMGVPTKFTVLNWADSGTCLAKTPEGIWVKNTNWQAFVGGGQR